MINEQELNRKLAEWAGFRHIEPKFCEACKRQEPPYWIKEGIGRRLNNSEVLIFTESLDACFKWLVPKLEKAEVIWDFVGEHAFAEVTTHDSFKNYYAFDSVNCALALCLAIEKLIDSEKGVIKANKKD